MDYKQALNTLENWKQGSRSAHRYTEKDIVTLNPGMLSYDRSMNNLIADLIRGDIPYLYVVYSYQTPILFVYEIEGERLFYMPGRWYSGTTTRFQNLLRQYVVDHIHGEYND